MADGDRTAVDGRTGDRVGLYAVAVVPPWAAKCVAVTVSQFAPDCGGSQLNQKFQSVATTVQNASPG
jgi:hypothetical protein